MIQPESTVVLIPAYNAEVSIGQVVVGVRDRGFQAIVVDDGSSDHTADAARSAGAKLLAHQHNLGKGHALLTGFRHALDCDIQTVITLDADGQHSPADLQQFIAHDPAVDLLIGQRQIDRSYMPGASFFGNCVSAFWISLFCGRHFPDTQCGFRRYSRKLLERLPLKGGRFEVETELLMRAVLGGLVVDWIPIKTIYQSGPRMTHFNNLLDPLRVIAVVIRSPRFPRGIA